MKKFLLLGLLAILLSLPAHADLKIGLVDTGKAFDAFYKTKALATRIATKKNTFEKEIQDLQAEYESARQEAQILSNAEKDTSLPLTDRQSKDIALAQKVQALQDMEKEIDAMRKSRSQEIKDDLQRSHQEISDAMMVVITNYVSQQGFDLVLDSATPTKAALTMFPYTSPTIVDITPQIIARLNASAPAAGH